MHVMIQVDRRRYRPAYLQLAEELRNRIQTGAYAPGAALPSESRLVEETGLGRNTVRAAIDVLVGEGLVTKQRGRGTVVRAVEARRTVELASGDRVTARVPAEPEARELLIAKGVPVLEVHRRGSDQPEVYPADTTELVVP